MKNFKGAVIKPAFLVHLMQLGGCHLHIPAEVQKFTSGDTRFGGRRNTRGKGGAPKTRRWRECHILTHGSLVTLLLCLKNSGSHTVGGFLSEHPLKELSQTTRQWNHLLTSSATHSFQTALFSHPSTQSMSQEPKITSKLTKTFKMERQNQNS